MTMCEQKVEQGMTEGMPAKLQSLRGSSLARRLEAEARRRQPRQRPPTALSPGKPKLSKYRRKCANAKERERMSRVNEMFDKLKTIVPEGLNKHEEDNKETKVTTLRSAITYINELQRLLVDYDTGSLDPNQYRFTSAVDKENQPKANQSTPSKSNRTAAGSLRKIRGKIVMKNKRLVKKSAKSTAAKSGRKSKAGSYSSGRSSSSRTPSPTMSLKPISPTLSPINMSHMTTTTSQSQLYQIQDGVVANGAQIQQLIPMTSPQAVQLASAVPEPSVEYVVYQTMPDTTTTQVANSHILDLPRNYVVYDSNGTPAIDKDYVVYEDNSTTIQNTEITTTDQSKDVNVINLYISLIDGKRNNGY